MHPELDITVDNPREFVLAIGSVIELHPQPLPEIFGFCMTDRKEMPISSEQ